jgi:hypothetical protein
MTFEDYALAARISDQNDQSFNAPFYDDDYIRGRALLEPRVKLPLASF